MPDFVLLLLNVCLEHFNINLKKLHFKFYSLRKYMINLQCLVMGQLQQAMSI